MLRCEYNALRAHLRGRRRRYGKVTAYALLAQRYCTDLETIRRRMRKARKLWPVLDTSPSLAPTYMTREEACVLFNRTENKP